MEYEIETELSHTTKSSGVADAGHCYVNITTPIIRMAILPVILTAFLNYCQPVHQRKQRLQQIRKR